MKPIIAIAALAAVAAALASATFSPSSAPGDTTGVVRGRIVFDGKLPEMKPLAITAEQAKGCCPEGRTVDTTDQSLVVGDKDGIANVVVTIAVEGAKVEPAKPVSIDQHECRFEPHVMVVPAGTTVEFLNSDAIAHNVHTYAGKNDSFNQTIAPKAKHTQQLKKEDRIEIKCDIHPWMSSHLVVVDTPHYALTKPDGSFEISGLPPGEHSVEIWHERLGKEKAKVVVAADGTSEAVEVKLGEKKKTPRR